MLRIYVCRKLISDFDAMSDTGLELFFSAVAGRIAIIFASDTMSLLVARFSIT